MHQAAELGSAQSAGLIRRARRRLGGLRNALTLSAQVSAASMVLAVIVTAMFALLLIAMSDLQSSTNAQARSRDVTTATLGVERVVNELELNLRAFIISKNQHFLVTWQQARAALTPAISQVSKLVTGQPTALADLDQLATLVRAYITEYGVPVIAIARLDVKAARQGVVTQEGLTRINVIRASLARLLANEDELASTRAASAKREASRAIDFGIGAFVAMGALLVMFGLFVTRSIARPVRTVAAGATRAAGGDLSTRLPEQGPAEVRQLTSAFNTMARSLEHGKRELEGQNEQLRQSERLKSELVAIVSHEVRTPLASILGYSSLLLRRDFNEEDTRRYLEIIQAQGNRLGSLIDEFLDVDRVEAGRLVLKDDPIDLKVVLLEEARLVESEAANHRVVVVVEADVLPIRGDRDRLAQVYGNLLTNAVKYSPDGGLVEVTGDLVGDTVRVHVRDQGIGIPHEHQARIFTKFFRGVARERGFVGTGLGLAVSREVVEAHGGRIGFTTAPGTGSTFWFELPRDPSEGA